VALDGEGLDLVERRGAAVIWCPSSNLFTLGATLERPVFERRIKVALATDSALTGEGDILDELQVAQRLGRVNRQRLYEMVTTEATAVLRLEHGEGRLAEGGPADLVAIPDAGCAPCAALTARELSGSGPVLVMVGGEVKLIAEEYAGRLPVAATSGFHRLKIAGRRPSLVAANIPRLIESARQALGPSQPIRLAGKVVEA
jgi:cytosine/adenosine deaminase-related metal-dependent hydrolase